MKEPNINESSIETSVNKQGQILLPLSSIKNVGSRADDIVNNQPYENLEDFATRARPNRLTVQSLAEACALECLEETHSFTYVEDFMVHWDSIVESRNAKEKLALRMKRLEDKNSLSLQKLDSIKKPSEVESKKPNLGKLLSDDLFD